MIRLSSNQNPTELAEIFREAGEREKARVHENARHYVNLSSVEKRKGVASESSPSTLQTIYLLHSKELSEKANELISQIGIFVVDDLVQLVAYKKAASSSPSEFKRVSDLLTLKRQTLIDEYNTLWKSEGGLSMLRDTNPKHFKKLHRAKYLKEPG